MSAATIPSSSTMKMRRASPSLGSFSMFIIATRGQIGPDQSIVIAAASPDAGVGAALRCAICRRLLPDLALSRVPPRPLVKRYRSRPRAHTFRDQPIREIARGNPKTSHRSAPANHDCKPRLAAFYNSGNAEIALLTEPIEPARGRSNAGGPLTPFGVCRRVGLIEPDRR